MGIIENLQTKIDKLEGKVTLLTSQVDKFLKIQPSDTEQDDLVSVATLAAETTLSNGRKAKKISIFHQIRKMEQAGYPLSLTLQGRRHMYSRSQYLAGLAYLETLKRSRH